jgi:hypothetical protein
LRLRKSDDLFIEEATDILKTSHTEFDVAGLVADIITGSEPHDPAHRALPDARLELERLGLVRDAARKIAGS